VEVKRPWKCPDFQINWDFKFKPKIALRPDYFLTPVFTYGPNNQMRGFREAVILAILTNS
jgi:hypothetical protein